LLYAKAEFFNNSVNEVTMLWLEGSDLAKRGGQFNLAMVLCTQIIQALVCTKKGCYKTCDLGREFEVIWSSI